MRANRMRRDPPKVGSPYWMITYGDMVTLLLAFFVALYAFSVIDAERFQAALLSIRGSLGFFEGQTGVLPKGQSLEEQLLADAQLQGVKEGAEKFLQNQSFQGKVKLVLDERGLIFRFQETVLFDPGKAVLKPEAERALKVVAAFLRQIPNQVRIEGHTCDLPIKTRLYPSNWELSTARATTVIQYFISLGIPGERLSAVGYGEYRPVAPNTSEEKRRQNRRVDILILKQELGEKEPAPVTREDEEAAEVQISPN
ncbi:MAG: OmpA family protein [Bacillota bacterium]|nr:OmpA family protein [Bacillota bacterium]